MTATPEEFRDDVRRLLASCDSAAREDCEEHRYRFPIGDRFEADRAAFLEKWEPVVSAAHGRKAGA